MIHPSLLVFGLVTAFLMVLGGAAFRKAPPLLGCKRTSKNFTCIVSLVLMLVVYSCVIRNRIGYYVLYFESDVAVYVPIYWYLFYTHYFPRQNINILSHYIPTVLLYQRRSYNYQRSYAYWMLTLNCVV